MPRPKRAKVAPSIPTSRGSKFVEIHRGNDAVEDIDDAEGEGIPTSNVRVRGVHLQDGGSNTTNTQPASRQAAVRDSAHAVGLGASYRRRDTAMERLEAENFNTSGLLESTGGDTSSSPAAEVGRRAVATPSTENSILAIGNFRRRQRHPSILGRGVSRMRSSSVESDLAESGGLAHAPAVESILVRGRFRRRPRQPSILGRANSRARSSSTGLEMDRATPGNAESALTAGVFKRRAREPSILGTSKKNQKNREHGYDGEEEEEEDEDDFNPEDESTPLNLAKIRSTTEQESQSASSVTNPRKRKLSPLLPPRPSSPLLADVSDAGTHTSKSHSPAPPAEEAAPTTPDRLSDTMAPPRSSSPAEASAEVLRPSRRSNIQQSVRSTRGQPLRKTLPPPNPDSLPSSPPSLTHSPNQNLSTPPPVRGGRGDRGDARPKSQPANLSTMQLQALLPRRRRRVARDAFEIESSDDGETDTDNLGSDEDELSHLTSRTSRTTRSLALIPAPRRVARLKPGPKMQSKANPPPASRPRPTASDKENHGDNDEVLPLDEGEMDPDDSLAPLPEPSSEAEAENSQELEERVGKELKSAKRKFEVVDKWELEFEDVTASSSNGWEGR